MKILFTVASTCLNDKFDFWFQGEIFTTGDLDRESLSSLIVTITAQDSGTPPRQGMTSVTIGISDVNDVAPVFLQKEYVFTVSEDAVIGTSVGRIEATDADVGVNREIAFSIHNGTTSKYLETSMKFLPWPMYFYMNYFTDDLFPVTDYLSQFEFLKVVQMDWELD